MFGAFLATLRSGAFLTKERLRLVSGALLLGYAIALGALAATATGISDYKGRPLGTDFSNVYAAGQAALRGDARAPFDPPRQYAEEQSLFGRGTPFYGWHYPPYFLLVAAPLALRPYLGALALYQLATIALYLFALWMLLRAGPAPAIAEDTRWIVLALAFPAAFVNLTHGNNGFLTAALLTSGLALIERRQIVAGILFGLLVYKPQFVAIIPLALAAGGYWRALAAGALTIAALSAIVTLAFGPDVWSAFLASMHFTRTVVLEQGNTGFNKIQSVFAWTRLWGGSITLAYILQGLTGLVTASALAVMWRRSIAFAERGAFLCFAALLCTPYCLDYDFVALAPAIALLAARGLAEGFAAYEKTLLAALWLTPIVARQAAAIIFIPIGTAALAAAAATIAWRAFRSVPASSRILSPQAPPPAG